MGVIDLELGLCPHPFGDRSEEFRKVALYRFLDNPCTRTWSGAHSVMLNWNPQMNVWQALVAIYPKYYAMGYHHTIGETHVETWVTIPTRSEFIEAIRYATH